MEAKPIDVGVMNELAWTIVDPQGWVKKRDLALAENAANLAPYGYYPTDLNGDGSSDSIDMTIIENNSNLAVFEAHP